MEEILEPNAENRAPEPGAPAAAQAKTRLSWREYLETDEAVRTIYLVFGFFAVALVMYIVLSADEKPTAGQADPIRVTSTSAQLIKKDGTDEPKVVLGLYEDFLDGWLVDPVDSSTSLRRARVEAFDGPLLMSDVATTARIAEHALRIAAAVGR